MTKFNWGIIGAGWIAGEMSETLHNLHGEIYAIAGNEPVSLNALADKFQIKQRYHSVEEILADEQVDIIYVATPHHLHAEIIRKSLQAGKHVLSEKAITTNSQELAELIDLAKEKGLILMEAMTVFHMPIFKKLTEEVAAGLLGKIHLVQLNFGSHKPYDPKNRFFNPDLAGGALLDIGGYATSVARLFLSQQPNQVLSTVNYFETGVDEESVIILKNADNQLASITLTMQAKQPKRALIAGEKGYLEIYDYPRGDKATFTETATGQVTEFQAGETSQALAYEVQDFENYIRTNDLEAAVGFSLEVMQLLDEIRRQWVTNK